MLLSIEVKQMKTKMKQQSDMRKRVIKVVTTLEPFIYLAPSLILFGIFTFFPFLRTIILSLSTTNVRGEIQSFVGLDNFIELFTSPDFYNSIIITFKFVLMVAGPSVIAGFILALFANNQLRGNRLYELLFSMPLAMASAPAAIIWGMIFNPTNGVLSYLVGQEVGWLTNPNYALWAVSLVTIWLNLGLNFIFLTTGLRNVPKELLESASIDGASYWHKIRKIVLPLVSPQLFVVVFMNIIGSFQAFGQIRLLTQGGPGDSTNVLVYSIYKEAFAYGRFEMACAQALVLFVIMLSVSVLQMKFEKKGVHYQ